MFLAMKEIRYSKLRYGLIIGIMFLIAYVVLCCQDWRVDLPKNSKKPSMIGDAQEIVLSEDANQAFAASQLTREDLEHVDAKKKHRLAYIVGQ